MSRPSDLARNHRLADEDSEQNDEDWYCGCCGNHCGVGYQWCWRCTQHVGPRHLYAWERTWFAMRGEPCPYEAPPEVRAQILKQGETT